MISYAAFVLGLICGLWVGAGTRDEAWVARAQIPMRMEYKGKLYSIEEVDE